MEDIDKLTKLIENGENYMEAIKFKNLQEILINNVDIDNIKQIQTDGDGNVYALFKDGTLYINKDLEDNNIEEIYAFDINHIYKVTIDNKIIPISYVHDEIDDYISNGDVSYKKIVLSSLFITALTNESKVISVSNMPGSCIIPDNFIDVDDIVLIDDMPYIIKNNELKKLYIF